MRYRLAGTPAERGGLFAATLAPAEGSRTEAVLRIKSGGRLLAAKPVPPAAKPVPLRLQLPAAGELTFEADFGRRVLFPCAVVLGDPLLIGR